MAILNQLAVELDITKAVDSVRNVVLELLHCEKVTLFLVDEQSKELRCGQHNPLLAPCCIHSIPPVL